MKETWKKFKEVVYIVTILGILAGWIATARITKFKNEMKDQIQDEKIEALAKENHELKLETQKQKGYVQTNTDNIDWIIRIFVVEPK